MSKLLKTLIVVLVALFTNINFSSAQQWSVTGNNISNSNTGNVGIGLTAPLMKMDIKGLYGLPATGGTQNGSLRLSHTSGTMVMDMGLGNSSGWIQTTNSGSLISTYPLLINPNGGNVGIGTSTTPIATLDVNGTMHVNGDINAYNVLTFQDKSYRFDVPSTIIPNLRTTPFSMPIYGIASPLVTGSADLWLSGYNAIRMFTASNPIPRLSILYNGYVGIGTLTPSQLLDIETNADYQFRVGNTTGCGYNIGRTVTTGYLTFYGDQSGAIGYNFGGVNGTLMTINGNGNVGIGQIMPTEKLEVNSTILINNPVSRGSSFLRLQRGPEGSDNATISFGQNSNYIWHTGLLYSAGNSTPNFYISQSQQIYNGSGTLVHTPELTISTNGNIGIGQILPTEKLEVNSTILINNPVSRGSSFLKLQRGPEGMDNATISFGQNSNYIWHTGLLYSGGISTPNFYISQSSQIYNGSGTLVHTPELTISTNGNIGIGTIAPLQLLDIEKNADYQFRVGNTTGCGYNIGRKVTTGYLTFYGDQSGAIGYNFGGVNGTLMTINGNGNVSIGTTLPDPTNAMLTVNGTIHAKEVDVDVNIPADYVFKSDYNLMSLNDVEKYVKTNSHLPDIPSAEEITKNGFKMGEMQNKLLQKVEELTLYVIEQQKKIDELEKKLK